MWLLLSGAAVGSAALLHGLSSRRSQRMDSVRRFLLVGVPVGAVLMIAAWTCYGLTVPALAAIALYAFLCELYIFCFTLAMSSISATMLIMLRQRPLQADELAAAYKPEDMVQLRIERLVNSGAVDRVTGRLVLTERGRKLHAAFSALSQFFGHPR